MWQVAHGDWGRQWTVGGKGQSDAQGGMKSTEGRGPSTGCGAVLGRKEGYYTRSRYCVHKYNGANRS